ncbi:autophagy regulatory protein Atg2, putative [Paecilomyces variotii No. 5]|uniref:Autophagy-related protein 2 n=1 Tax=Byssochlamys spectabilis (strain No. 5 / NBRC 109023) TaxID=1356009 RepID=V5F9T1_BYSSN|nr:autophagy regulatory protein Atg2, putative [Paecilomyces variotii No. 5]
MAYFLPSFFQKRLLRYALSRLELIDTDALDLDRLGIRWGQRSTFELRDIGLKLEKLSSLLHLPAASELLQARILLLRVTIPADIYSSGIIAEVEGVSVHLRLLPNDPNTGSDGKERRDRSSTSSRHHAPHRSPSFQSDIHDPGGDQVLPTTTDLAQSFLESEPREEKAELQAAISSQSGYLSRSSASLSDDEELGLGQQGVSLPSFIAGFLKGVVDRLQVKIKDVALRVDMELEQDAPTKRHPQDKPDPITGLLTIRELCINGVDSYASDEEKGHHTLNVGKRLITLSDTQAMLLSDPVVFSNYARFATPPSPPTTHSKESQTLSRTSSPTPPSVNSDSPLAMTHSTILQRSRDLEPFPDPEPYPEPEPYMGASHTQRMGESTYTADGRFSDAGTDAEFGSDGYQEDYPDLSASQYDDQFLDNPAYLEDVFNSHLGDDVEGSTVLESGEPQRLRAAEETGLEQSSHSGDRGSAIEPHNMENSAVSGASDDTQGDRGSRNFIQSQSVSGEPSAVPSPEPHRSSEQHASLSQESRSEDTYPPLASPASDAGSAHSQSGSSNGGLSESKIFSHEEAESMYMSAISHASTSKSYFPDIPGAWESPKASARDIDTSSWDADAPSFAPLDDPQQDDQDDTIVSTPKLTPKHEPEHQLQSSQESIQSSGPGSNSQPEVETISDFFSPSLNRDTDVAKKILDITEIKVWLPSEDSTAETDLEDEYPTWQDGQSGDHMRESTVSLSESTAGEFASSRVAFSRKLRQDSISSIPTGNTQQTSDSAPNTKKSDAISVEVASVSVQFDIATGWLLTKMGQRLLSAHKCDENEEKVQQNTPRKAPAQRSTPLSFSLNDCSIRFLEHLPGSTYPAQKVEFRPSQSGLPSLADVILQTTISGLRADLMMDTATTKLRLELSKVALGFASEDLLSFNEGLKMRESTRDILSPVHGDISLSLTKTADFASVNLTTLPLHLNLNLQRLEEVMSWFGGLSTILELGSSIASVSTVRGAKPEPTKRPRGVHFEATPPTAKSVSTDAPVPWKVNVRLGGLAVDVVGENHGIKLETTAVKLVSRSETVGLQIDKAKLKGPLRLDDGGNAPAKVSLGNIRILYLFSPKEVDLDRLLSLLTPSKDKYEDDDDIMLDTLFRQRKQGAVLRVTVDAVKTVVSRLDALDALSQLGNEMAKLSNVTKYLPEDDRPGILTLALVKELEAQVKIGGKVGDIGLLATNLEAAHISIPSLVAAQLGAVSLFRNGSEELVGEASSPVMGRTQLEAPLPMIMVRFIAEEMEPTIKVKLNNFRVEYTVPAIIAFMGIDENSTGEDIATNMAQSVASLADLQDRRQNSAPSSVHSPTSPGVPKEKAKPLKLAVALRNCVIGLNPRDMPSKGLVVFTFAKFLGGLYDNKPSDASLDIRKACIMIIDDIQNVGLTENLRRLGAAAGQSDQVQEFINMGYVPVSYISSAMALVKLIELEHDGSKSLDVELRDDLLILETCADSTQTLISILNGLSPPTPPSTTLKYRTEVMPIQDMLASFSGDAFATDTISEPEDLSGATDVPQDYTNVEHGDDELEYVSEFYPSKPEFDGDMLGASMTGSAMASSQSKDLLDSFHTQHQVTSSISELDFQEDHFAKQSAVGGTAHRWDSSHNTYGLSNDVKLKGSPLRVRVRDVHVIWNLFDGYDWQRTRDTISKAVKDVEMKATERRARAASRASPGVEDEDESVIGDFLFNSIYIGIPANKDPRTLAQEVNRDIDDLVSETGSYATSTTVTGATVRHDRSSSIRGKKLRLSRSKHHKMTFELKGISADFVVFPPGSGETVSSLDVRVNDLEIFDHIPTSTWKKFATYMHDAGERESGTSMIHIELLNVKPVPDLAASEIVLKATVLPLRLHVDQDALDFMSRFFEFKDENAPAPSSPSEQPFLQRVEVNSVRVRLDFKPKRVDYGGLRSGRTTEFMNFFVLDNADMVLRHVIIYGVSGFEKLGLTLNDIWMPDVKRNQLPGVLAGLAPIRSIVNVGSGVKDLVVVPMREYKKDGRIVRSIQKGAMAFAKTTTNELVKLGAKLAIGTQTVLQGAEDFLNTPGAQHSVLDDDLDEEEKKQISLYADQPVGVVQGLRGAYSSLERDLLLTRDAIVAVPGEIMESGSAAGAAKAVWKRAPTVILRPAIGATKAVGQTLLGAGNTLDPTNRRRMDDKYKRH